MAGKTTRRSRSKLQPTTSVDVSMKVVVEWQLIQRQQQGQEQQGQEQQGQERQGQEQINWMSQPFRMICPRRGLRRPAAFLV